MVCLFVCLDLVVASNFVELYWVFVCELVVLFTFKTECGG